MPRQPLQVRLDAPPGWDEARLTAALRETGLGAVLLLHVALGAVLAASEPVTLALDELLRTLGRPPQSRREREAGRRRFAAELQLIGALAIFGRRTGTYRDRKTREPLDLAIREPLLQVRDGDGDPETVTLAAGPWLARFRGNRSVLSNFGDVRRLANLPGRQAGGAWAQSIGLALQQRWREQATHAERHTARDGTQNLRFRPFTRRELLTLFRPEQVAAACGCPALFVTCEMEPLTLLRRVIARVTQTFLDRLLRGELAPEALRALAGRTIAAAPELLLLDATAAPALPDLLLDAAAVARGKAPHLLLVIDSVHTWAQMQHAGLPEYEALNQAILDLQSLAHALSCPILASWERNRASMQSGGLSAGAGTRKIEYSSETVLDLTRPAEALPDLRGEVTVTLTLAKNRHGLAGAVIPLRYHGAWQQFREAAG